MWGTPQGMVCLATGHHDMRRSINGLALVVAEALGHDPVGAHWFVFCNRGRDRLKILHWDTNGFWLHCRRLEQGRFHWPKDAGDEQSLVVTARQLRWLIDGLNWQNAVAHQPFERRAMHLKMPDKPKAPGKKRGCKSLPAHLPRKRVEHDLPESEKVCGCCQGALHRMGEETSEQIDIIPIGSHAEIVDRHGDQLRARPMDLHLPLYR